MGFEITTLVNIQFLSFAIIVFIFKNRKTSNFRLLNGRVWTLNSIKCTLISYLKECSSYYKAMNHFKTFDKHIKWTVLLQLLNIPLRMYACRIHLSYYSNPIGFYVKTMSAHGSWRWPSWMVVVVTGHNFERILPKDHLCHVCLTLADWFQRRRL